MVAKSETLSLPEVVIPERLTISNSLAKDWKACRRKFFYNYLARLSPRKLTIPYFVGSHFHRGMQALYSKKNPDEFIPGLIAAMDDEARKAVFLTPEEEEKLMFQSAIVAGMLRGYADYYSKDHKKFKVLHAEQEFEIPITPALSYVGAIDLIVEYEGGVWIVEHKTAGRLDKNYIDRLALDTQITGYTIGARIMLKRPIAGVIYNVAKKPQIRQRKGETPPEFAQRIEDDYLARPEFYFYREEILRDTRATTEYKAEIAELAADMQEKIKVVEDDGPEKALPHFYRNTDHCTARGPCPYLAICTKGWNKDTASLYRVRESLNPELAGTDADEGGDE